MWEARVRAAMRDLRTPDGYSHTISTSTSPFFTLILATLGFKLKRRGPAAPGLTTSRRPASFDQRLMSMAEDDDVRSVAREQLFGCRTADLMAVAYVDGKSLDVERRGGPGGWGFRARQCCRKRRCTGAIAPSSLRTSMAPDVARVKNQFDAGQRRKDFRTDEVVRIGHQANEHRSV